MEDMKSFAEVYEDMNFEYDHYLKTGEETELWELCHQVLSNALFILNKEEVEDTFTYEFPKSVLGNAVISRLLNTSVGKVNRVCTIPQEGIVWFLTEDGTDYDDDSDELTIWEIFNIATALYKMTEPLSILYQ